MLSIVILFYQLLTCVMLSVRVILFLILDLPCYNNAQYISHPNIIEPYYLVKQALQVLKIQLLTRGCKIYHKIANNALVMCFHKFGLKPVFPHKTSY